MVVLFFSIRSTDLRLTKINSRKSLIVTVWQVVTNKNHEIFLSLSEVKYLIFYLGQTQLQLPVPKLNNNIFFGFCYPGFLACFSIKMSHLGVI